MKKKKQNDLQKVMPELVQTDDSGYLRVSYDTHLSMVMLQAVKELKAENDGLKEVVCGDHPEADVCRAK